jgi:hypothetical protein
MMTAGTTWRNPPAGATMTVLEDTPERSLRRLESGSTTRAPLLCHS